MGRLVFVNQFEDFNFRKPLATEGHFCSPLAYYCLVIKFGLEHIQGAEMLFQGPVRDRRTIFVHNFMFQEFLPSGRHFLILFTFSKSRHHSSSLSSVSFNHKTFHRVAVIFKQCRMCEKHVPGAIGVYTRCNFSFPFLVTQVYVNLHHTLLV